ncbi:unnamed protein product [Candida verbasci]|uniref:Deacetylase sirtuin-type domain-containing protein n=1 Tax=Candida verbasci TaxID=1227364 RepID=A0A9W4TV65_9ASCO|nr:unnamed protein product [Candida verbasci]
MFKKASIDAVPTVHPLIDEARSAINEADFLIISAAAGSSASAEFDYTSKELFKTEYQPFLKYNIKTLYATIGFPWPNTPTYQELLKLAKEKQWFVITTNADGFFIKNGLDANKVLTPQGNYSKIQCSKNCSDNSYRSMDELVEKYSLTKFSDIPKCDNYCFGMNMFLGESFNDSIVKHEKTNYKAFIQETLNSGKKVVILELLVGLNTPSLLRWPNERKNENYPDIFKLIRISKGPSSTIPTDNRQFNCN